MKNGDDSEVAGEEDEETGTSVLWNIERLPISVSTPSQPSKCKHTFSPLLFFGVHSINCISLPI